VVLTGWFELGRTSGKVLGSIRIAMRDAGVALQVGLGWWAAKHHRVSMDEGEILALLLGQAWRCCGVTRLGHLIHL
jgi:hypothetical protein